MSKLARENESLNRRISNARARLQDRKQDLTRKGVGVGTSFVLGALKKNGKLASLPTIPGLGRITSLALVANAAGFMAPRGTLGTILDGIGESSLNLAAFSFGAGEEVAGFSENDVAGVEGRKKKELRRLRGQADDLENEIRQLVTQNAGAGMGSDMTVYDVPNV